MTWITVTANLHSWLKWSYSFLNIVLSLWTVGCVPVLRVMKLLNSSCLLPTDALSTLRSIKAGLFWQMLGMLPIYMLKPLPLIYLNLYNCIICLNLFICTFTCYVTLIQKLQNSILLPVHKISSVITDTQLLTLNWMSVLIDWFVTWRVLLEWNSEIGKTLKKRKSPDTEIQILYSNLVCIRDLNNAF